jgi:hypothetical protein
MATTTFQNYVAKNVGVTQSTLLTAGGTAQTSVIGLSCANTTSTAVTVDIYLTQSSVNYYIVKGATVPAGGTLVAVGGDQKLVLKANDQINVVASTSSCIDVIVSALVVT